MLLHKPLVLGITLDVSAYTRDNLDSVQRTAEKRIYVTRLVGSRKKIINPPKVNLWIGSSGKVLVCVVCLYYCVDMAVRKLRSGKLSSLGRGQELIQPYLADELGELVFYNSSFLHCDHLLYMMFGIVLLEQA